MIALLKELFQWLAEGVAFLVGLIVWAAVKIFTLIASGVLLVLEQIPVPDFMGAFGLNLSAIDPGIWYFAQPLNFGTGMSWVVTAYGLRFLIRRLPVVG